MPETRVVFRYTGVEVTSAQRIRYLRSGSFRWMLVLWFGSVLFAALHVLFPQTFQLLPGASWALVGEIALLYGIVLFGLLLAAPWLNFLTNRFWRLPLELYFSEKHLRLAVAGKGGGLRLLWKEVRSVDDTPRAFIVTYGDQQKYIILPKSAFSDPAQEQRFRELIARRTSLAEE